MRKYCSLKAVWTIFGGWWHTEATRKQRITKEGTVFQNVKNSHFFLIRLCTEWYLSFFLKTAKNVNYVRSWFSRLCNDRWICSSWENDLLLDISVCVKKNIKVGVYPRKVFCLLVKETNGRNISGNQKMLKDAWLFWTYHCTQRCNSRESQPISGQFSHFTPPENTWKSKVFRGYKMEALIRNGLKKKYCYQNTGNVIFYYLKYNHVLCIIIAIVSGKLLFCCSSGC